MKYLGLFLSFVVSVAASANLVQVLPSDHNDIQMLAKMDLPIYCQMEKSYIGVLNSSQTLLLEQNMIDYNTIGPEPADGEFYMVTPPAEIDLKYAARLVAGHCQILLEHAGSFFVVGEPQMIEYLPRPPLSYHPCQSKADLRGAGVRAAGEEFFEIQCGSQVGNRSDHAG